MADNKPRQWYDGETLRYSSGYAEEPIGRLVGMPTYPAPHADKPDVLDVLVDAFAAGGARHSRTFQSVTGKCEILNASRDGQTLSVVYRDPRDVLRQVNLTVRG